MKKEYVKEFCKRGLAFSGLGPVVMAVVYLILSFTLEDFTLSGSDVFLAVISTYILAFVHAGASIFNQIESWSVPKGLFFHLGSLYLAYTLCYLINSWIPFEPMFILIFTGAFVATYFVIWLIVFLIVRQTGKGMNKYL